MRALPHILLSWLNRSQGGSLQGICSKSVFRYGGKPAMPGSQSIFRGVLMTKRQFMRSGVLFAASLSSFPRFSLSSATEAKYPFPTLSDAMAASDFDPHSPGSFTAVFAADLHYGHSAAVSTTHLKDDKDDQEHILPPMLREINAMQPLPKF